MNDQAPERTNKASSRIIECALCLRPPLPLNKDLWNIPAGFQLAKGLGNDSDYVRHVVWIVVIDDRTVPPHHRVMEAVSESSKANKVGAFIRSPAIVLTDSIGNYSQVGTKLPAPRLPGHALGAIKKLRRRTLLKANS